MRRAATGSGTDAKAPKRLIKQWHRKDFPPHPESSKKKRPTHIGSQSWEVALRPGTTGKTSNSVSAKKSFMCLRLLGYEMVPPYFVAGDNTWGWYEWGY